MKPFSFFPYVVFNFVGTIPARIKLNNLKKKGNQEEVDDFVNVFVSKWSRSIVDKIGIKVNVQGNENIPEGSCLFVSNHQGSFDFFAFMGYINKPVGFVAKTEIGKFPYFPQWMRDMHCVFIDRANARESVRAINEAAENLKNGYSMVIFPEGTRSKGKKMGEFKKGSLKLAQKSGVPIVPVTLDGSYKVYEETNGKEFRPAEIKVVIDKPIYLDKLSKEEIKDLSKHVQSVVQKNLDLL